MSTVVLSAETSGTGGGGTVGGDSLPYTGAAVSPLVIAALSVLLLGLAAIVTAINRRSRVRA